MLKFIRGQDLNLDSWGFWGMDIQINENDKINYKNIQSYKKLH